MIYTVYIGGANMEYRYNLDYKIIAQKIKSARKSANITQAELAEKIGVSTNAVAKLETNLMKASLKTLINITNVLNLDINQLIVDENIMRKDESSKDIFFENLIYSLSKSDRDLIIHIINGLKIYKTKA